MVYWKRTERAADRVLSAAAGKIHQGNCAGGGEKFFTYCRYLERRIGNQGSDRFGSVNDDETRLSIELLNRMALGMAKSSFTSMEFFLNMPVYEMLDWWKMMTEERGENGKEN